MIYLLLSLRPPVIRPAVVLLLPELYSYIESEDSCDLLLYSLIAMLAFVALIPDLVHF